MTEEEFAHATIQIRAWFPNLSAGSFDVTSPIDRKYNCIALAADDASRWWWPSAYWPIGASEEETLDAFVNIFGQLGYEACVDGLLEDGYEKVAIYGDERSRIPKHAARQMADGRWISKLGQAYDIVHDSTEGIEGSLYGFVLQHLRRKTL